jgi:outer membrane protein assembly factor BamA
MRFVSFLILVFFFCTGSMHSFSQGKKPRDSKKDSVKHYKNKFLVFPLTALSTETSWVFGVANAYIFKTAKKDSSLRVSTIPSGFLYTLNNQILIALGANIFLPRERYIIRFENSFSKFPDKFWGLGNGTDNRVSENYTFTQVYVNPQIYRKVVGDLFLGTGVDYQRVFDIEYSAGGYFDQDKVLGVSDRSSYSVFGFSFFINHDSRNHAYQPDRGDLFRVKFSNFNEGIGSDYTFQTVEIDFRKYFKVTKQSVLAIQSLSTFNFGNVPYRNLAILGGNNMMRGYYAGRFRDLKFAGVQAEYRFPVKGRVGGVGFIGVGEVAKELSDFRFEKLKPSIGAGVRVAILRHDKLNLRFDVAGGSGGSLNYYIVLAESF